MELHATLAAAAGAASLLLCGCAETPPASGAAASAPSESGPAAAVAGNATDAAPAKNPFPGMVRRTTSDGTVVYCRNDAGTGSRIPKTVCATERDLRNQAEETRRIVDDIGRTTGGSGCPPSGC